MRMETTERARARDTALHLLNRLTYAAAFAAVGLVGLFTAISAATIPSSASASTASSSTSNSSDTTSSDTSSSTSSTSSGLSSSSGVSSSNSSRHAVSGASH